MQLQCS
jgi:hypothetical protein